MNRTFAHLAGFCLFAIAGGAVQAADLTAKDVTFSLFQAKLGKPIDFSGKNLAGLDLAGLDFKGARLTKVDLLGADLSDGVFKGSDLSGARLDRATITRADFSGAILEGVTILRPSIYSTFTVADANWTEAPKFTGAKMAGAKLFGRFDFSDFKGADLKGAQFTSRDPRDENTSLARSGLFSGDFDDANLEGADFTDGRLGFAELHQCECAWRAFQRRGSDARRFLRRGRDRGQLRRC